MSENTTESLLLREDSADGITTLTLNRPDQFNSLCESLLNDLVDTLQAISQDESVRVVILTNNGRAFCAGHDLKEMRENTERAYFEQLFSQAGKLMTTILKMPQPVIAKVRGVATAAGCQLVATCDLAISEKRSRFGVSGINVGLFCGTPSVALSRNMGRKQAMEMLLTGELISAEEAQQRGLINRCVESEELDGEVAELAQKIAAKSTPAVQLGKQMFYRQLEMGVEEAYAFASERMACNMMFEDTDEGIDAFTERRPPNWKHR